MIKKIVLMGNPNVGKSVVFSRLTGTKVISSNYPGTTVDYSKGNMLLDGKKVDVIDAPGTYSLEASNKAEQVAVDLLKDADVVIDVIDSTNLERNLYLAIELLERDIPVIIALNLWDEAKHVGIHIDEKKLEEILGVPVVPTVALTGEGIKTLVSKIKQAKSTKKIKPTIEEGRWIEIGNIIKKVEKVEHRHHSLRERVNDLTIRPLTGIPIAAGIIFVSFWIVRLIGESIIEYIMTPIFESGYKPLMLGFGEWLGDGIVYKILISDTYGVIEFTESFGILTTGLYVPIAMVLPYIIAFYFLLSLLEDSGYLPRLATLVDNVFHRLGMHGFGIIPLFLGFGCNVPGLLATRTLETRKQRFIAATLLSIAVPCMAQLAVIFAIIGSQGLYYIGVLFTTLLILYITIGILLNKVITGSSPEIFLEIPAYRRPSLKVTGKKTLMRIRWFLREAVPFLFVGVAVINIFHILGVIQWVSNAVQPFMYGLFGLPGESSVALITGFLRKDLAIGMLSTLNMSAEQLVVAVTMLTIYFPCVASFVVLVKELGVKDMIKAAAIMICTAILVGMTLRFILIGV
jgi:ferrous iron transport protein B